jgi:hypothetical protein
MVVLQLQIGCTLIASAMRNCYVIDADYCETIKDPAVLGQFVNKMLTAGIPDKYVAFNLWMVSDKSLKGNAKVEAPTWGMSRVVFRPEDPKIVYKMALNGWGIRSNISEIKISEAVYAAGQGEHFAKILWHDDTNSIVSMERLSIDKSRAKGAAGPLRDAMKDAMAKAGIKNAKMGDQTPANTGFRGDVAVSFDYGMPTRITDSEGRTVGD